MNSLWTGGDFLDNVIFGDAWELTWIREEEGIWTEGTHGLRHGSCTRVCLLIVTLFGVSLLSSRTGGSTGQTGRPSQSSVLTSTQAGTRRRCWRMWRDSWISSWFPLSGRQVDSRVLSLLPYHWWGWLVTLRTVNNQDRATGEPFGSHLKFLDLSAPCRYTSPAPRSLGVR